ncbi:MAG TPA: hypothetical protein VH595_03120 [Verrucomicrobiae bacterium]|jgi:hypothetical protein|nr:hypothetical protein [Verrucomicrobiae bacterium]
MKDKTFLTVAAKAIGMDKGNLSRLASDYNVPLTDKRALIALGREHQRDPAPDTDCEDMVSLAIVKKQLAILGRKIKADRANGKSLILDLVREIVELRGLIIEFADCDADCLVELKHRQAEDLAFIAELNKPALNITLFPAPPANAAGATSDSDSPGVSE